MTAILEAMMVKEGFQKSRTYIVDLSNQCLLPCARCIREIMCNPSSNPATIGITITM